MRLDEKNKNHKWPEAEITELGQLEEYNPFLNKGHGGPIPQGYKKI